MPVIPSFDLDGLLPAGDYEVSFEQLRCSVLALGPNAEKESSSWDTAWRGRLIDTCDR
jgi:hypothetical protein